MIIFRFIFQYQVNILHVLYLFFKKNDLFLQVSTVFLDVLGKI